MNLNQLLYFARVARTGSYTRAAEEASVSEPVVYKAVRKLEKTCQMRLFERSGKRIRPTPEGEIILEYAARIERLNETTEQAVAEHQGHISGNLSLGVGIGAVEIILPAILPKWLADHPLVNLSVTVGQPNELQKDLLEGRFDLLISAGAKWDSDLRRELLFSDELAVVSCVDHQLTKRSSITISELSEQKMLTLHRGTSLREAVDEVEYQYGVRFKTLLEVNRMNAARTFCRSGLGIAILPISMIRGEIERREIALLNVEGFPRPRPNFLVYRADTRPSSELKSFLFAARSWGRRRAMQAPVPWQGMTSTGKPHRQHSQL